MGALIVGLLVLIGWQVVRVEPLRRPAFETVVRAGEQLFPIAVPPLAERRLLGVGPSRFARLEALSVAPVSESNTECAVFVRISRNHWRRFALAPADRVELGLDRLGGEASVDHASMLAADAVDDDDGDGRHLDAGELRPAGASGIEVEIACRTGETATP